MSSPCAAIRKLEQRMESSRSMLCVGLDPEWEKLPARYQNEALPLFSFCRDVVQATAPYTCAFKPNTAFFEARGTAGWMELTMLCALVRTAYPDHFLICDAKRADIGHTNYGYVRAIFDDLGADAVTLHPLLGSEALAPFLERTDRASILLCRTSNAGAGELQDLSLGGKPLWAHIAEHVSQQWNTRGNCMLVVGATWPEEMQRIRALAPEMNFLVPGIGAQGGDLEATVRAGVRKDGRGLVLSSSRAILYAADPGEAARHTRDAMEAAREMSNVRA